MSKLMNGRARRAPLVAMVAIVLMASGGSAATDAQTPEVPETLERRPDRRGNPVLHWNRVATEILPIEAGPVIDSRAMAILHAAVHDAVNGVERRYEPYAADLSSLGAGASLEAAVASAAREILNTFASPQRDRIEQEYAKALAAVPDGPAEDQGVALGQQAARSNLDRRANDRIVPGPWPPRDGPIAEPVYVPTGKPGDYDFTPPFDAPPLGPISLFPGWGRLTPFVIDLTRHRLEGPDPLDSKRYARDFDFLKSHGRLDSTTRTADQTATSFFWFEPFPIWNDIARTVIERHDLNPWRAARILALMNFALADSGIACFDAKYRFRFWRPYTAIRRAGEDGNDRTEPDPEWLPLLWTPLDKPPTFIIPPIPDYPSAAADTSAAAAEVLTAHLGDRTGFEVTSITLPGVTRRFKNFSHAAREAGMSRVYGGIHFLHAVEDGFSQGRGIGRVVSRALPPVRR
jgi:hypothetical protein